MSRTDIGKVDLQLGVQGGLVVFDLQDILAVGVEDLLGDVLLTTQGVDGYHRPVEFQQLQQLLDGREFLALARSLDLGKDQVIGGHEGADHVGHAALVPAVLEAAAQALAVDGHQLAGGELHQVLHPLHEAVFKSLRLQFGKNVAEGVVGGNAVGQLQKGPQPGQLGDDRIRPPPSSYRRRR